MHEYFVTASIKSSITRNFKDKKEDAATFTMLYERASVKHDAFINKIDIKTNDTIYEVAYTENVDGTIKNGDEIYMIIRIEIKKRAKTAASLVLHVLRSIKNAATVLDAPEITAFNIVRVVRRDVHVQGVL